HRRLSADPGTAAESPAADSPSLLSHPLGSVRGVRSRPADQPKEVLVAVSAVAVPGGATGREPLGPPPAPRPRPLDALDTPLSDARVDTLTLARRLVRDEVADCRLATLAARFRTATVPTHRALDDVLATAEVLHALFERAAGFGVLALDDLLSLPSSPLAL